MKHPRAASANTIPQPPVVVVPRDRLTPGRSFDAGVICGDVPPLTRDPTVAGRQQTTKLLNSMARVTHFEIQADKPERAIAFYSALFDWQFTKWDGPMPYWLIVTGPDSQRGINGGLLPRRGDRPAPGQSVNAFVCTVEVDNLDATLEKGSGLGGTVVVPKMPIPGVGWLAYLTDTEGNIFGAMQSDPAAR